MRTPTSTYRLQFSPSFGFQRAAGIFEYLEALGVGDVYASPLLRASSDADHGYAVTDPGSLDPRLGTDDDFASMCEDLHSRGVGLLLDIVPNHMAASVENAWWRDVLRHGRSSGYARFFDIDWRRPGRDAGRIVLPILGKPLRASLAEGEIRLDVVDGALAIVAPGHPLPVDPATLGPLLRGAKGAPAPAAALAAAAEALPHRDDARLDAADSRRSLVVDFDRALNAALADDAALAWLNDRIARINQPDRRGLGALIDAQAHRPMFWRDGLERINYRRFFDIADLVCLRQEDDATFNATHALIAELIRSGRIAGLRVDHVDGLADPAGYLERLQALGAAPGEELYVLVEKILGAEETLPANWRCAGATGYQFTTRLDQALIEPAGVLRIQNRERLADAAGSEFEHVAHKAKKQVMRDLFMAEMRSLRHRLLQLAAGEASLAGVSPRALWRAFEEVTACLPVYRTYVRDVDVNDADHDRIVSAVLEAGKRSEDVDEGALWAVQRILTLEICRGEDASTQAPAWVDFIERWQQFTGPITAKGVEDTALYAYPPFLGLNEVGAEPTVDIEAGARLHGLLRERAERFPGALNTTSTHDTKRSEDVRARLLALSEFAEEWMALVEAWRAEIADRRRTIDESEAPNPSQESLLFQTLVGVWPLDDGELDSLGDRVASYIIKAEREAKRRTSWIDPDQEHEEALRSFSRQLVADVRQSKALEGFGAFQRRIAFFGAINSLTMALLRCAAPGVPDLYQGCETWMFSLVDPDNRRPVDFEKRATMLSEVQAALNRDRPGAIEEMRRNWRDGRIKMAVISEMLRLRRDRAAFFLEADHLPLEATGSASRSVLAFARRTGNQWMLAAAARRCGALPGDWSGSADDLERFPLGSDAWTDSTIALPPEAPRRWRDVLTGERVSVGKDALSLAEVFSRLPQALLIAD